MEHIDQWTFEEKTYLFENCLFERFMEKYSCSYFKAGQDGSIWDICVNDMKYVDHDLNREKSVLRSTDGGYRCRY